MVSVRKAVESDVEAVRAVGYATWPQTYGPLFGDQYVERGLARWWDAVSVRRQIVAGATYVAELNDDVDGRPAGGSDHEVAGVEVAGVEVAGVEVIGVAVIGRLEGGPSEGNVPFVWKLYVRPDRQKTGAGRALLDAVIADLRPTDEKLWLDHAEGNDNAHGFYERHGFHELFRYEADPGHREVRMERRLRP